MARLLTSPEHARTRSLITAISSATVAGAGFGLLMPLVSLNLEAMTGSGTVVGLNATAAAISTLVMTPLLPAILAWIAPRKAMIFCTLFTAIGVAVFPFVPDVYAWWVLRFVTGCAVTLVFVGSETWINQLARPETRATLLAVYATALSGGFGSGALLLTALGSQGFVPWLAGSMIFLLGAVPLALLRGPEITPPDRSDAGPASLWSKARLAPAAMTAGLVFGAMETSVFSLLPVYVRRLGFEDQLVGIVIGAAALGGLALQIPIGRLADRIGRRLVLRLVALGAAALPPVVIFAGSNLTALLPLVFVMSGLSSAFYTLGLALVGERVDLKSLAAANAAFIFAYGLGSLVGPPMMGAAMDALNPYGLMITFTLLSLVYLSVTALEKRTDKD